MIREHPLQIATRATPLGWIAVVGRGRTLLQVVFGHRTQAAARAALEPAWIATTRTGEWCERLAGRLEEFAAGGWDDFRDLQINVEHMTPFQRQVIKRCRAIEYGQTRSYAELAVESGSPRAARAVGNTMAANRYPLVVPCHRVISSDGSIGPYSAPDGVRMKARLLEMEKRGLVSCQQARELQHAGRDAVARR